MIARPLLIAAVAAMAFAGCADDEGDVAEPGTTTTSVAPTTSSTSVPDGDDGVDGTAPPVTVESADDTVQAWVEALAEGDVEQAWDLTADRSRQTIGSFESFTSMASALSEGFGAYGAADDVRYSVVPLETGGDEALAVVVLTGTISQEGPPAPAAASVPVRITADGGKVEPFLDLGGVEFRPPPGSVIPADPVVEALVPAAPEVQFIVDNAGARAAEIETANGDERVRATLQLDHSLDPGRHSVTVVLTRPDGAVDTSTALYSVEG